MKLYATVSSERATKGQGGNEYLDSVVSINKHEVLKIQIDKHENGTHYALQVLERGYIVFEENYPIEETKGKKQKGDCDDCMSQTCLDCTIKHNPD